MRQIFLILLLGALSGCVTFTDTEISKSLPKDISDRNTFMPTATWKRHLSELGGSIVFEMEDNQPGDKFILSHTRILKSGTNPVETVIAPDEGKLLEMLIDSSADTKLSAIGIGNGSLGSKEKMSFVYRDLSEVFIPDLDEALLQAEATKPLPPGVKRRWWIQAALLSGIQRKKYTEVTGTFSKPVNGSGIGADGNIYSSSEMFSQDYAIHLTMRNLEEFKNPSVSMVRGPHVLGEPGSISGLFVPRFSAQPE